MDIYNFKRNIPIIIILSSVVIIEKYNIELLSPVIINILDNKIIFLLNFIFAFLLTFGGVKQFLKHKKIFEFNNLSWVNKIKYPIIWLTWFLTIGFLLIPILEESVVSFTNRIIGTQNDIVIKCFISEKSTYNKNNFIGLTYKNEILTIKVNKNKYDKLKIGNSYIFKAKQGYWGLYYLEK